MTKADPGTPGEDSAALVSLGSAEDLYHKHIMHFQSPHPKVDPSQTGNYHIDLETIAAKRVRSHASLTSLP